MEYRIIRNERRQKPTDNSVTEIFICLEMDDGTEYYSFGYWLTQTEVAFVLADESTIDTIAENASIRGERAFNEFKILREMSGPTDAE